MYGAKSVWFNDYSIDKKKKKKNDKTQEKKLHFWSERATLLCNMSPGWTWKQLVKRYDTSGLTGCTKVTGVCGFNGAHHNSVVWQRRLLRDSAKPRCNLLSLLRRNPLTKLSLHQSCGCIGALGVSELSLLAVNIYWHANFHLCSVEGAATPDLADQQTICSE